MDVDRPPENGRIMFRPNWRMAGVGAAWLILAGRFLIPLEDLLQRLMSQSAEPLLQFLTLFCSYRLTVLTVDKLFPGLLVNGELVAMLLAVCLALLNVLETRMVTSLVVVLGSWRLLRHLPWAYVFPRHRPDPGVHQAVEANDGHRPVAVLEQLGEVKMVVMLTDLADSTRYLWLNSAPEEGNQARYLLKLIPERTDGCHIPLKFVRENMSFTWYTGVQTLAIMLDNDIWRTENLGLNTQSLKALQDVLANALIEKQCSDQPPCRVTVINAGLDLLKNSAQVITIGFVNNGFLVVRREDLDFDVGMTEVRAIRAIYFVQGVDTIGDLNPPAAFGELQRFHNSLQRLIYMNVLRPFMECTANPPAV